MPAVRSREPARVMTFPWLGVGCPGNMNVQPTIWRGCCVCVTAVGGNRQMCLFEGGPDTLCIEPRTDKGLCFVALRTVQAKMVYGCYIGHFNVSRNR